MIAAPMVLLFWARSGRSDGWRRQQVFISLLTVIALLMLTTSYAVRTDEQRLRKQFEHSVSDTVQRFAQQLHEHETFVNSLASYIESTPEVDADAFRQFVKGLYASAPKFLGLSWCPRVAHTQRLAFEARHSAESGIPFHIVERDAAGKLTIANTRAEYFPVMFIEPSRRNVGVIGFDLNSERVRRDNIASAVAHDGVLASERIELVQYHNAEAILLMQAVRDASGDPRGVVSAVFLVRSLSGALSAHIENLGLQVQLFEQPVARDSARLLAWPETQAPSRQQPLTMSVPIQWAGREYRVEFRTTAQFMEQSWAWQIWLMLVLGLLLASLLEAMLFVLPTPTKPHALTLA